ncbi:hypothetical protein NHX12_006671 [Muraenolepis orangiensis]|uniref:Uncharacterized protein n=1 Tax=Muraenolepis orangiensis TaxID=630683 RepID=A0A9Q0IB82_9TELE|nr:hypothetical protein NHX12_006671 [Muraenolepis orangiensis]
MDASQRTSTWTTFLARDKRTDKGVSISTDPQTTASWPPGESIVTLCDPGPSCTLKVQVNDALGRQGLKQVRVEVFVDYTQASSAPQNANLFLHNDAPSYALFQPSVEFPQSLLNVSSVSSDVSSLSAYFTAPLLQSGQRELYFTAITATTSGYSSAELCAVAAVSVQMFSREAELQVTGPLQMSLPLEPGWGLQPGDHVPAWLFNHTAGGWMRGGLGTVVSSRGKLFQTKPKGALVSHPRRSKRDQSTSTYDNGVLEMSMGGPRQDEDGRVNGSRKSVTLPRDRSALFAENTFAVEMESSAEGQVTAASHTVHLTGFSQQTGASLSLNDGLFFYNQPLAALHAPAFFHADNRRPEERCRSSAPPQRPGVSDPGPVAAEPPRAAPSLRDQTPTPNVGDPLTSVPPSTVAASASRGRHLPESLSVPGTLNEAGGASPLPPRAWFVSLEGKPAAEIHRGVSDQNRRRRRPTESRDTSLDSGVDMSELNQTAGRRAGVALDRSGTFMKRGQQP